MTTNTQQAYYLCGPMNGLPEHNYPAFHAAAKELRDTGVEVVSPAELDEEGDSPNARLRTWEEYMARDLPIVRECRGLILLPGWENSRGATVEVLVGALLAKPTYLYAGVATRYRGVTLLEALQAFVRCWVPVVNEDDDHEPRSVLAEAEHLIHGPRQDAYTHPADNFRIIGELWGTIIKAGIQREGAEIVLAGHGVVADYRVREDTVGLMMAALKLAREVQSPGNRDNLVDAAGYIGCVELIRERQALDDAA